MVSIHLLEKAKHRRKVVSAKPRQLGSNCTPLIVWFPSLPNQGPRSRLWRDFCPPGSVDWHSRPPAVFPLTLANGYAERLIGSIRRGCIDHVVVFGERHLRYVLLSYKDYYNATRTHLSLRR
jgi:hypothetical protein